MPEYNKESLRNTIVVAVTLCLVCSVIVSTAAVVLKPMQKENQLLDRKQNVLRAAGVLPAGANVDAQGRTVDELFSEFDARVVNLETGEYVEGVDPATIDPIKLAKDPAQSFDLDDADDTVKIGRRENVSVVYIRKTADGAVDKLVLPVRGPGLWGTMFGFLAIEGDLKTIAGLGFYAQKETPGLGGEVDNPVWKAKWPGVHLFDDAGEPAVRLVKTRSTDADAAAYEVDALSGATFTTKGVESLVNFWTGDLGFGPFISNLKTTG